jgi:7-cyano-7-deazaguanine reductase
MATPPTIVGEGVLGKEVKGAPHDSTNTCRGCSTLDVFELSESVQSVTYTSDEVTSICPVTGQPDQYTVEIDLYDSVVGVESKSLKLFLQSFRNEGQFCEAFASTIAHEVHAATLGGARVLVTQKPRGGITIRAHAHVLSRLERLEEPCLIVGDPNDYGMTTRNGKATQWNRATWMDTYGDIPHGKHVLHHCDIKGCRNPHHLYLGTHAQNIRDRDQRHLQPPIQGSLNGRAKLTDNKVVEIRKKYRRGGVRQVDLAAEYGVTQSMISFIVREQHWKIARSKQFNIEGHRCDDGEGDTE